MAINDLLDKHDIEFREIAQRLYSGESINEVAKDYFHLAENLGVGRIGLACYVCDYVRKGR